MGSLIIRIFVISSLLMLGCIVQNPYRIRLSPTSEPAKNCSLPVAFGIAKNVPDEYKDSIKAGFEYWNNITGIRLFFDFGDVPFNPSDPEAGGFLIVGAGNDEEEFANPKVCGISYADYNPRTLCYTKMSIVYRDSCMTNPDKINTIIRHEAGHALGLGRSYFRGFLMHTNVVSSSFHPVNAVDEEVELIKDLYK